MDKILEKLSRVRPDLNFDRVSERDYEILLQSHFVVQRFLREINEGLDQKGIPSLS
jgi:hypothetical protein